MILTLLLLERNSKQKQQKELITELKSQLFQFRRNVKGRKILKLKFTIIKHPPTQNQPLLWYHQHQFPNLLGMWHRQTDIHDPAYRTRMGKSFGKRSCYHPPTHTHNSNPWSFSKINLRISGGTLIKSQSICTGDGNDKSVYSISGIDYLETGD